MLALKPRLPRPGTWHQDPKAFIIRCLNIFVCCVTPGIMRPHGTCLRGLNGVTDLLRIHRLTLGSFGGLLEGEEGQAAALSTRRICRGQSRSGGPRTGSASPAHSRAAPGELLGTSPLSGGRLHSGHVPAQPASGGRDAVAPFAWRPRGEHPPDTRTAPRPPQAAPPPAPAGPAPAGAPARRYSPYYRWRRCF